MIVMAIPRRKLVLFGAGFAVAVAIFAWRHFKLSDLTFIGTGYTAEQTCACLLVAGRSLESCKTDLDPLARKLISVHPGKDEVTATAFVFVSATAQYEKGFGCTLKD